MTLPHKIESKLEKSLGTQFNIQLQQQMGVFQVSMLEVMQSLREEFQTMKKASEVGVDQTSASASKPGTSKQTDELSSPLNQNLKTQQPNTQPSEHKNEPMEMDFCGPSLPTVGTVKKNTRSKQSIRFRQNTFLRHLFQRKISPLSILKCLLSPKGPLLSKTNNNMIQTQSFTGR